MNGSTRPLVAVVTKNGINPAYAGARLGADRTAAKLGYEARHYFPEKPDDVDGQLGLIAQALSESPDAIVLLPAHVEALNPIVRRINAARIPLAFAVDRTTEGECITFVGSSDYGLAADLARYLFDFLGGKGEIAIVEGPVGARTNTERVRAFIDTAGSYPGIRIIARCRGDYQQERARLAMSALLDGIAHIDGILAANDPMALGVLQALDAAHRTAALVGVNATPEAIQSIRNGRMLATASFDAMAMACIATEGLIRHRRGETVPLQITLPVAIVDRSNCAALDKPYGERELPEWNQVLARSRWRSANRP